MDSVKTAVNESNICLLVKEALPYKFIYISIYQTDITPVLGPFLFLIYVNDIDEGLTCKISKFADETKITNKVPYIAAYKSIWHISRLL